VTNQNDKGLTMKAMKIFVSTSATLALLATQAWAGCTSQGDALALKTAAVQQELMVAAFQCGDTDGYNRFVTAYQRDLQDSDAALLAYFQRTGSTADYHTYKTSLANDFSLISARNDRFCAAVNSAFAEALDPSHPALQQIVADQPVTVSEDGQTCGVSVASSDRAMLPHEDEAATQEAQSESVNGGSWDGARVASRAPN
jgi:basic membrane lipoprotein Med (substrate-binding protein (PBP1-ABC) superfamily)